MVQETSIQNTGPALPKILLEDKLIGVSCIIQGYNCCTKLELQHIQEEYSIPSSMLSVSNFLVLYTTSRVSHVVSSKT